MALSVFAMGLFGCSPKTSAGDDVPDMSMLDRGTNAEMRAFLNETFPVGTDKAFVERALIDEAGAKYKKKIEGTYNYPNEKNIHQYIYKRPFWRRGLTDGAYLISIFFDENSRVNERGIQMSGPDSL